MIQDRIPAFPRRAQVRAIGLPPTFWPGARRFALLLALIVLVAWLPLSASATPRDQARRIHDRIVGTPPSEEILQTMTDLVAADASVEAAYVAMEDPSFYNTTLKHFAMPWTNRDQTIYGDLNDYVATVIGMVRDEVPFNQVLSADLIYVAPNGVVDSRYSHTDNDHYFQLQQDRVDLSDPDLLVARTQSGLPGSQISAGDAAGVLTTRAAGAAFLSAGTNRRMVRFTLMNHLCRDMDDLADPARPADRISQDINRSPGGDSALFHNQCVGCHSGMDPLRHAWAYFNFDEDSGRVVHTSGSVQPKMVINATNFPGGFIVTNNRWDNFWREGNNAYLGWRAPESGGYGAQSLGIEFAESRAFSVCQVEKVYREVCLRNAGDEDERLKIEEIADVFEREDYSMKRVFAEVAAHCAAE